MDFSEFFATLTLDPTTFRGLLREEIQQKIEGAYRNKESELSQGSTQQSFQHITESRNTLLEYTTGDTKFSTLADWIVNTHPSEPLQEVETILSDSIPQEPLNSDLQIEKSGAILSQDQTIHTQSEGNSSFKSNFILDAYKKYYQGIPLEDINKCLLEKGITSWKLEVKKEEELELPSIEVVKEGYLKDPIAGENKMVGQNFGLAPDPGFKGAVGSSTNVVLRNFLLPDEMKNLLYGIDTLARYDVFGSSLDEATQKRAKGFEQLRFATSEALDIQKLTEVARERYRMPQQTLENKA